MDLHCRKIVTAKNYIVVLLLLYPKGFLTVQATREKRPFIKQGQLKILWLTVVKHKY